MTKYNAKGVYAVLFTTLDNLSDKDQGYLFENIFTDDFLDDIKNNPKKAYSVLNDIVIDIEDGKTNKIASLMKPYKDKIYMMKNMLKDYGNF